MAGRLNSRHEGLKQKPLIPNSGGTLLLEQQGTTEQLKHRAVKQQLDLNVNCKETDYGEEEIQVKSRIDWKSPFLYFSEVLQCQHC